MRNISLGALILVALFATSCSSSDPAFEALLEDLSTTTTTTTITWRLDQRTT